MKEETKKLIKKIAILFSPIFTIIMFALPWCSFYNYQYKSYTITNYNSYIELLQSDLGVFSKIILYVTLIGVLASTTIYILSVVIKDKEKLLIQIASITLLAATGILFLLAFSKFIKINEYTSIWADFMTIPYGLLIVYNVVCVYLVNKKEVVE